MDVQLKPLLKLSPIDVPPKFLQSLQDAGKFVKKLRESDPDIVNSAANRSGSEEEQRTLQAGLLYLALTEPDRRRSLCTDIVLTARDSLTYVLSEMTRLVAETWPKMPHNVRSNLICLLAELIATRANVEVLMLHIYRRMITGDISLPNLWLIESICAILENHKDWVASNDRQTILLPLTVYTYLRLIPDHHGPLGPPGINTSPQLEASSLTQLRQREAALIEELIRKNFDRCAKTGREFIRLLHGVARIESFKRLWDDLFTNISSLGSGTMTLSDILYITTPPCYTQSYITQEMEQWVRWLMKNVHCVPRVPVNRYQEFFQRKYFSTPESQALRVCLIRYIVTFFYPDNEMLASTLIPRWNVISWVLSQSTCPVVTANAKLALFYDWLFYRPEDCIMNLEPALLAMMNHLTARTQPIALSLVDFLIKISAAYFSSLTDRIVMSIRTGLDEMIRLGVVKNINPLLEMLNRTSPDLLHSFRILLGCEPPVVNWGEQTGRPPADLVDAIGDTGVPTVTVLPSVQNCTSADSGLRRPSTPPISIGSGVVSKPASDSGPPTDPRLTRGRAARLSSVAPESSPLPMNVSDTNSPAEPSEPVQQSSTMPQQHPVNEVRSTCNVDQGKSTTPGKRILPVLSLPVINTLPPPSKQIIAAASKSGLLSDVDLNSLNADEIKDDDARLSNTASWSPPPIPPSQAQYRAKTYHLPDTPESIESTIENLRQRFLEYQLRYRYAVEPVDIENLIDQLDGSVKHVLERFRDLAIREKLIQRDASNMLCAGRISDDFDGDSMINGDGVDKPLNSAHLRSSSVLRDIGEALDSLVEVILSEDSLEDREVAGRCAAVVCELLYPFFAQRLIPTGHVWSDEQLEACLDLPVFVAFRHLAQLNRCDPKREVLLLFLVEMQVRQPRLGYHLLFFLKSNKPNDESMVIYRDFCDRQDYPNLRESIFKDMQLLADDNRRLFAHLLPDLYTSFSAELNNDIGFFHFIVGALDPVTLNMLVCEIVRGHLNMFQSDDLSIILRASLDWNSLEQFFFWQLVNAHEIPTRSFLPLVELIEPDKHPEACSNLILLFKLEKPSFELVRALLTRHGANDALSVTALHFWSCPDNQHSSKFARILRSMILTPLSQRAESSSTQMNLQRDTKDKRKQTTRPQSASDNHVSLQLILTHLDSIRRACKNISLLQDDDIQYALQEVTKSAKVDSAIKNHFSDLLALAEDEPTAPSGLNSPMNGMNSPSGSPQRIAGTSRDLATNGSKTLQIPGRSVGITGSKGGHRLRNLDSRRAAEAERRRLPSTTSATTNKRGGTRTASGSRTNRTNEAESDNEESSATSTLSEISDDDDEEDPDSKSSSTNQRSPLKRESCDLSTNRPKRADAPITDRRSSNKRNAPVTESRSDEDDDDDLEVKSIAIVLDDDSGDEKAAAAAVDDTDHVRPPKRRKTANRRFLLDD